MSSNKNFLEKFLFGRSLAFERAGKPSAQGHEMTEEFQVEDIEHRWIEMPDGVRLSARIWLPKGAGAVPAILEYIPYRKRDLVRARDARNHPFFAAHGYACLRVDMRGSGDSEGHLSDMYTPDELSDARHVIAWIAAQDWCNGAVGIFGTSWGGTASLQAAGSAPDALKAVIANCATVDRFEDDIHWMGGCVLTDSFEWGATLPAILAAPPDAATVGMDWRAMWEERLNALTFPLENWSVGAPLSGYGCAGSGGGFSKDRVGVVGPLAERRTAAADAKVAAVGARI